MPPASAHWRSDPGQRLWNLLLPVLPVFPGIEPKPSTACTPSATWCPFHGAWDCGAVQGLPASHCVPRFLPLHCQELPAPGHFQVWGASPVPPAASGWGHWNL